MCNISIFSSVPEMAVSTMYFYFYASAVSEIPISAMAVSVISDLAISLKNLDSFSCFYQYQYILN